MINPTVAAMESLEEQNKKLLKTQYALEKKVSQLKDFAGIITHDVRGPAHNISKMLEMYESTDDPELKNAAMDYLKKISKDLTNNLNELIQILQITKKLLQKSSFFVILKSIFPMNNSNCRKRPNLFFETWNMEF